MKTLKTISVILSIIISLYFIYIYIIKQNNKEKNNNNVTDTTATNKPQNVDVIDKTTGENLNNSNNDLA